MASRVPTASARAERRAAGGLLVATLRDDERGSPAAVTEALGAARADVVVELARYHRIGAWVHARLRALGVEPVAGLAPLAEDHERAVVAHLRNLHALARVSATLDERSIPWMVVKGPVIVELLYGRVGTRGYLDLDLVVDGADFEGAIAALEGAGGRLEDRNWRLLRSERRGEVHLGLVDRTAIDLHWDLINHHRGRMRLATAVILDRSEVVDLGGVTARTPDATDSLIHLAVHAAMSGGDRLIWLKDLDRAIVARPPSWPALVERSRESDVAGPVGIMLTRTRRVLGSPVPPAVLDALLGRRRVPIVEWLEERVAIEASSGGRAAARWLPRAIGHGLIGGSWWTVRHVVGQLERKDDPSRSAFAIAGDEGDRAAYFAAVRAAGRARS